MYVRCLTGWLCAFALIGCGGADSTNDVMVEIEDFQFSKALDESSAPIDPCTSFLPNEDICLSLQLKGKPTKGKVSARFYFHEDLFAEVALDVAEAQQDLSDSENATRYVGFTISVEEVFYVGKNYRAVVLIDDKPIKTMSFEIMAPDDATEPELIAVETARGATEENEPIEPTDQFSTNEQVFVVGRANFGIYSWLEGQWFIDSELVPEATRSLVISDNLEDIGFSFYFRPEEGWPTGTHEAALIMNDKEVGRVQFTITDQQE